MKSLHQDLIRLLSDKQVLTQPEDLMAYASDATYYYASRVPDAVVLPVTSEEVARVMKYAYEKEIPVTPRGAGSGLRVQPGNYELPTHSDAAVRSTLPRSAHSATPLPHS